MPTRTRRVWGSAGAILVVLAGDVRAWLAYVRSRPEIDDSRLGLIGHSEGANIAARFAADVPDLRFIVMLAGAGLPGDEILYLQAAQLGRLQGASPAVVAWDRRVRQSVYELIESEKNLVSDETRRQALIERTPPPPGAADATAGRAMTATLLKAGSGAWFHHFLADDPASTLGRIRVPALLLFGGNDVQVPATENAAAARKALDAGGRRDYRIEVLPGLNHLFQTSKTGSPAEYEQIDETVAPAALEMMADWIGARTGR